MNHSETARELFLKGYNCSQAVLCAFEDVTGLDRETAAKLASSFGGGMGRMRYMVLGALLLATAQHLAAYFLDSKWMNATAYVILIIFLCFRPYGFSGRKLKKTEV